MHEDRSIAFNRDDTPIWPRDSQSERQWKRESHRVLHIEVFRPVIDGGPEIGRIAQRGHNKCMVWQLVCEHLIVVGSGRPHVVHHWTSSCVNRSANGVVAS